MWCSTRLYYCLKLLLQYISDIFNVSDILDFMLCANDRIFLPINIDMKICNHNIHNNICNIVIICEFASVELDKLSTWFVLITSSLNIINTNCMIF